MGSEAVAVVVGLAADVTAVGKDARAGLSPALGRLRRLRRLNEKAKHPCTLASVGFVTQGT